ncbi:MAG TPA: alkaline phosphatase family protein [Stellaceae bacterium]|nr:alkaline phosphatase family protein [Stellaceae bacterium]
MHRSFSIVSTLALGIAVAGLPAPSAAQSADAPKGLDRLQHIIVVYLENHSFDNLFGTFPGANGLSKAGAAARQVDIDGKPYVKLPPVNDAYKKPPGPDPRFPADLPNRPFLIDKYVKQSDKVPDLVHRYYHEQAQIDGGKMDKFAAISDAQGLVMGYHDGSKTRLWNYAREFTLADNFFHAAFGGSFLNHFWTICACTPRFENAPAEITATVGPDGKMIKDGQVTPDGYAVNTIFSVYQPHPASITDQTRLLPPQTLPTIGDRLSAKNISWAWYSGGWNDALAGKPDSTFQYHHQAFAYFTNFADGTEAKRQHLKDEVDFLADIESGNLPAVVFYKPLGRDNEHPGYTDVTSGDRHITAIIDKIRRSKLWASSAIFVTYDEHGGYWDHVAPPKADRWGPGIRVPTVIISPFAKRHFVDHTSYDTTSILRLIEERFDVAPLGERDAKAADLRNAFNFAAKVTR